VGVSFLNKNETSSFHSTTLTLTDFERHALEFRFTEIEIDSPEARLIEIIATDAPHLLMDAPLVIALARIYHQHAIRGEKKDE
jgi:hypothetical protein